MNPLALAAFLTIAALSAGCSTTTPGAYQSAIPSALGIATVAAISSQSTPEKQQALALKIKTAADALAALTDESTTGADLQKLILSYTGTTDPKVIGLASLAALGFDQYRANHPAKPSASAITATAEQISNAAGAFLVK